MGQRVLGACVPDVVKMLVPSFFLRSKSRFRTSANTRIYRTSAGADKTGAACFSHCLAVAVFQSQHVPIPSRELPPPDVVPAQISSVEGQAETAGEGTD